MPMDSDVALAPKAESATTSAPATSSDPPLAAEMSTMTSMAGTFDSTSAPLPVDTSFAKETAQSLATASANEAPALKKWKVAASALMSDSISDK